MKKIVHDTTEHIYTRLGDKARNYSQHIFYWMQKGLITKITVVFLLAEEFKWFPD